MNAKLRKNDRFRDRREWIIDEAARLFARNGYASTGISELCDALELGRGTLYYYIGSKEELIVEIHERVVGPLIDDSELIAGMDASPYVRLRLISETLLRLIVEMRDHVWVFLHEHRSLEGKNRRRFEERRKKFESVVEGLFDEGRAAGDLVFDDLHLTTLAFLGMHNYTYQWVSPKGPKSPQELSEVYCTTIFRGLLSPGADWSRLEVDVKDARQRLRQLEAVAGED
jgi:TetR/AcrR family transcriptional regulator, cholesterol catabolism regulator